jgi:hypothetical protein
MLSTILEGEVLSGHEERVRGKEAGVLAPEGTFKSQSQIGKSPALLSHKFLPLIDWKLVRGLQVYGSLLRSSVFARPSNFYGGRTCYSIVSGFT